MNEPITLKISLPRIPDIELVAIEGLDRLARHLGIAEEKIGEAKIIVTEAIINALEHSGRRRPCVKVEFTMTPKELVIFVRDFGKGFEPASIEDPDIETKTGCKEQAGMGTEAHEIPLRRLPDRVGSRGTKITIKKLLV